MELQSQEVARAQALHEEGVQAFKAGNPAAALERLERAALLAPKLAGLYRNMGVVQRKLGNFAAAVDCFRRQLAEDPQDYGTYYNLGNLYYAREEFDEAAVWYQRTAAIRPGFADVYNNWGRALLETGQVAEALRVFEQGLQVAPELQELRFNYGMALLSAGRLEEGFREYRGRVHEQDWQQYARAFAGQNTWRGEYFSGKRLLVFCEQGYGDCFQFVRYLPLVKQRGGVVDLWGKRELQRLFNAAAGLDHFVVAQEGSPDLSAYDYVVPLLDLPVIFGTTLATVPARLPYLAAEWSAAADWRDRNASKKLKVGLVWAGNTYGGALTKRSASLAVFAPLAACAGVDFYSLQIGESSRELAGSPYFKNIVDCSEDIGDFADTAAIISQLDLVVTIDTSVAHLAGALGRPVWVMLPFGSEWRWLRERSDSPWYPTMRLYRQPVIGDWATVVAWIAADLTALAAGGDPS